MVFSAVFIISALFFSLEILGIRILSFSSDHYLTYMVTAVSVMGAAAAGIVLSIRKNIKNYMCLSFISSVLFTLSLPLVWFFVSRIPLDSMMVNKLSLILFLFADYVLLFILSFFAGLLFFPILEKSPENTHLFCFFSILGLVAGAAAVFPLMEFAGAGGTISVIVSSSAFMTLLISFSLEKNKAAKLISVFLLLFSLSLYPLKDTLFVFRPASSKILSNLKVSPENSRWNKAGRIDIVENFTNLSALEFFPEVKRDMMTIDGDSASFIYDFSENPAIIANSLYSAGYFGLQNPDVFVAGLSMTDIASALFWHAKSVTTVEANKARIDLTVNKYSKILEDTAKSNSVEIVHDDIRTFLAETSRQYDLIQFSGVDSQSALLNGMYIMNESYLYTSEAFEIYISRLKENGTLAFIRWMFWPPRETLKIAAMSVEALKKSGIKNPENNIVIIGNGLLASTLVKKRPFTWTEINEINDLVLATSNLRIIYAPGFSAGEKYYAPIFTGINFSSGQGVDFIKSGFEYFFDSVQQGREGEFIADYPYNIQPAVDDSPFFFNYFKFGSDRFSKEIRTFLSDLSSFRLIMILLIVLQLLFLTVSMLVSPVFFMQEEEKKHQPLVQIISFLACGFGFMFIVMSFIQNFTLLFGNPAASGIRALSLFLVFSALGSLFSKKILILLGEKLFFGILLVILPLTVLGYAVAMPHFTAFCAGFGFAAKFFLIALFAAPLAFTVGTVFPVSLLLAGEKKRSFIPLAFSANGAALIFAYMVSVIIAMAYGFKFLFVLSAFCYFFAVSAMLCFLRQQTRFRCYKFQRIEDPVREVN